ncbi:hypothetical protein JB92DRAFT_3125218 [Gautieria morchelliformis]|nr:hypothetical protein JB92DRAFT_3125218 [Gautieria morchelliformis]
MVVEDEDADSDMGLPQFYTHPPLDAASPAPSRHPSTPHLPPSRSPSNPMQKKLSSSLSWYMLA